MNTVHQKKQIRLYRPETFLIDDIPAQYSHFTDSLVYLCHLIIERWLFDSRHKYRGAVSLKASYLQRILGPHYTTIIAIACEIGLIERDPHYTKGRHSRKYILGEKYRGKWVAHYPIDRGLIRRLKAWKRREKEEGKRLSKKLKLSMPHQHVERWLLSITVDEVDIRQLCDAYKDELKAKHDRRRRRKKKSVRGKKKTKKRPEFDIEQAIEAFAENYQRIRDGDFFAKPDRYGRCHTNITNLWSELRRYLRYKGQPLVNVDIHCSQPLFLCLVLIACYQSGQFSLSFCHTLNSSSSYDIKLSSSPLLAGDYEANPNLPDDLKAFVKLVVEEDVYTFLGKAAGRSDLDRSQQKERVFGVLYGKNNHPDPFFNALQEHFSSVASAIVAIKKEFGYSSLAKLMQRFESAFIYGAVVRRLQKERPYLFLTTIHDSVMTVKGSEQVIIDVMEEEFRKLGLRPQLKVEDYSETTN